MSLKWKRIAVLVLCMVTVLTMLLPAVAAEIKYMPDVTAEMANYRFWAGLQKDADDVILTQEEIKAFNQDTIDASGTMVMDLKSYVGTFDGIARYQQAQNSAKADAEYYYGWTYNPKTGKLADWSYYAKMINNVVDPQAKREMPYRYGIAVNRTVLKAFPSDSPIWDDPADVDFDYQSLSAVRVNEPLVIYTTSNDGKYYMARTNDCSGWIAAKDVALCADRDEWLAAWDLPSEDLLVVYGNKIFTETSIYAPETSRRLLTQGTALEIAKDLEPDQVIINRYPYHNYVVYLPVRNAEGRYEKQLALISEKAKVRVGYLPLTTENIAMVALENLGDTYGWGGMLDVEDCSGMVRTVYACFGLEIARNGNWQWKMNMEKIDMAHMSLEEKYAALNRLPLGAALCFPGHEMIYLGKYGGKYYVLSSVGSLMSPESGERLRVRSVIINTLDAKRANGQTWLQAVDQAFMPCYPTLEGKNYDFPDAQWYRDGVGFVLKNSLIANYENGYFGPNDLASREVAVNALWRLAGRPEATKTAQFSDVSAEEHYMDAICWANENAIVGGYGSGKFGPEDTLTREQMVTVLWRYAKHLGYDVSVGENTNILSYGDAFAISKYAVPAMQWACGSGLLIGEKTANGGMVLKPHSRTTRAQLSMMLMRFDTWMKQAKYAPHVFDLSKGDLMFSAGAEEYSAYLAADPTPEKVPAPAYATQDGGETWTELKGEIIVVTTEETENGIAMDMDAPYGEITITLDGVNTTGDMMFYNLGDATIIVKGNVATGTINNGSDHGVHIYGADGEKADTLTVNSPAGYGVITGTDVYIEGLDGLYVNTGCDGIYSEEGNITIKNVSGAITSAEGCAALKSDNPDAIITVNGNEISGEIGADFAIRGETAQED